MQIPIQVTFREVDHSDAVKEMCEKEVMKLERFHHRITSCRVTISAPHRHHNKGSLFSVAVDLTVPGGEVVVNKSHHDAHEHEDLFTAIKDAFRAARRRLEDFSRKQRHEVKTHEGSPQGRILRVMPDGFGFIGTPDGREIYFHENSVLNGDFAHLGEGTLVRYAEEDGEDGPQASAVHIVK